MKVGVSSEGGESGLSSRKAWYFPVRSVNGGGRQGETTPGLFILLFQFFDVSQQFLFTR
jgi:hypothetical protein